MSFTNFSALSLLYLVSVGILYFGNVHGFKHPFLYPEPVSIMNETHL